MMNKTFTIYFGLVVLITAGAAYTAQSKSLVMMYLNEIQPTMAEANSAVGKVTESIDQEWDEFANAWVNKEKEILRYDNNLHVDSRIVQLWTNGGWENYRLYDYTNDGNGNAYEESEYGWNGSAYEPYAFFTNTYDSDNKLEERVEHFYVGGGNIQPFERVLHLRTPLGNWYINELRKDYWLGATWDSYERVVGSFNDATQQLENITQNYQTPVWENKQRRRLWYTNDTTSPGNNYLDIVEIDNWENNQWVPWRRLNYQINTSAKMEFALEEEYNVTTAQWEPAFQIDWVYNSQGDQTQYAVEINDNGTWRGLTRRNFTYVPDANITSVSQLNSIKDVKVQINRNFVQVGFLQKSNNPVSVELFDSKGEKIQNFIHQGSEGSSSIQWDYKDLNKKEVTRGIYYLKLSQGNFTTNLRVLKVH